MPIAIDLLPPRHRASATPEREAKLAATIRRLAEDADWQAKYKLAAETRMAGFDALPKAVRLLVHEYGSIAAKLYLEGWPPGTIRTKILIRRAERDAAFDLEL